jgi:hypothetical protein
MGRHPIQKSSGSKKSLVLDFLFPSCYVLSLRNYAGSRAGLCSAITRMSEFPHRPSPGHTERKIQKKADRVLGSKRDFFKKPTFFNRLD